jgi:uncharacterized protein (UPF0276 family)
MKQEVMISLATPTSHLFKVKENADNISSKSDCLELREFMIGKLNDLDQHVKLAHLDEVDITLFWNNERKDTIKNVIDHYKDLELVSFHMSCNCTDPIIEEGVFVSGGKTMKRSEMLRNAKLNIQWLREILPSSIKIAVENNNYYPTSAYEDVTDSSFISEVVLQNNINFLFDISHALVTCFNKKIEYSDYIDELPLESIIQIHLCSPGLRDDLAYDLHLMPNTDHIQHALSLARKTPTKYLTVEYYKNPKKLISFLTFLKEEVRQGSIKTDISQNSIAI